MQHLPRDVWRYRVAGVKVADLRGKARLARVGLEPPMPGRRGWGPYQEIGEALWKEGWRGLVAPSAARAGGRVLCLFLDRRAALQARPYGRRRVVRKPPAPPTGMRT